MAPELPPDVLPPSDAQEVQPGVPEQWWERSAWKMLVGGIVLLWAPLLTAWIAGDPVTRPMIASATDATIKAVLAWAGVTAVDRGGLRKV